MTRCIRGLCANCGASDIELVRGMRICNDCNDAEEEGDAQELLKQREEDCDV